MKKSHFHDENDSKQKEKIEIKNTTEEKTNTIKEIINTNDNNKDNELTVGDPNIPVLSNNEDKNT